MLKARDIADESLGLVSITDNDERKKKERKELNVMILQLMMR
jgi:hypothetical protein